MKRDERLRRAQLASLLLDAIEKAEQLGEPDIAEIVREFRAKWKTPYDSETPAGESSREGKDVPPDSENAPVDSPAPANGM